MIDMFKVFHDAAANPQAAAHEVENNRKIIGYLCSYAPEELIHAAGFHPMRLFASNSDIIRADDHLQAYCCSLVRGVLEESLAGRLDFLYGAVFAHTCDSLQRLSDIYRLNATYHFFADLLMPAKLNAPSSAVYMVKVLERFRKDLADAAGHPVTDQAVRSSIALFNKIRSALARIYAAKSKNPAIIKGADLAALARGAMIMDRNRAATLLTQIADELKASEKGPADGKRILLSGSVCDSTGLYEAIEEAGGQVVADDLCTGRRFFEGVIAEDKDPLTAISQRYLNRVNCPAKHICETFRGDYLLNLAKEYNIDGVVFLRLKFCDPHAFDYPYLKDFLDRQGIKNTLLEMDDASQSSGQVATRIETFIHTL